MPIKRSLISLLVFCICFSANAQLLNFKNYSIEDGLPQSQIIDLIQDNSGRMWFATNGGGVSCFDGLRFTNFSTRDGLSNNRVFSIFQYDKENIFIGTTKGLSRFYNNKVYQFHDPQISEKSIYSFYRHSDGNCWIGTSSGIYLYDGKTFKPFQRNDSIGSFQVWSIKQDKLGNTWIATMMNGVFCYDGKSMKHFTMKDGLTDLRNRDILINNGKVWVTSYRGIHEYDPSKAYTGSQSFKIINESQFYETVYKLFKDSLGNVWAGTAKGVMKITYGKIQTITKANGLCGNMVDAISQDREGNMWFGSFAGGVSKYQNDLFINYNEKHGLVNNTVMSIFKDSRDNFWIGTWGGGVSKFDYNRNKKTDSAVFENYSQKDGLIYNNVWSITEDKKGNIWFGTSASGISVFDGKNFKNVYLKEGLHGIRIPAMITDRKGNVWIAHENGVDVYDGKTFTLFGVKEGLSSQGVNAIYQDNFGDMWFGSVDKITKYDGKGFTSITRPEGFPRIRNLVRDHLGYIWISTDLGVAVYNGKNFYTINELSGLSSNTVYYVNADDHGYLWIGTNNGIDRLDIKAYVNQKEVVLKHYGKEEGFIGLECNQNAFYRDVDGKLWIGTIDGVTIYNPDFEYKNKIPPQTQITDLRLFLESVDLSQYSDSIYNGLPINLSLPYDKNHITFDFVGVSQTIPDKVRYRFMLQNFDKDWLPEGKETSTTYSNLPPGQYTFLLKASNNDGVWNPEPVAYSFEIVPPFWKRPWFYIIAIAIGFSLIYAFIKMRERSLQRSRQRLKEEVAIRTRELLEEKEKLQVAYSEIDEKNKDITDSIHYAKRIQQAILPADSIVKQLLPDSFVFYKPKDIVSGDFYWLEQWGPQTLVAAVDCTGHGVPGAFMSIVAHNILTQAVNVLGLAKPALILNETNTQLSRKLNQNPEEATVRDGMDIAMCAINYKKSTMEFAGANNPVWLIRNGQVIEINGDKFPIGAFVGEELQKFTNHEWEIQKGDCIYIFTDGFADQFGGPKGKKFKYKPFQELLLSIHALPMAEQKEILQRTNEEWQGALEQVDDVLVIGLRI
ncbi:MAG TPA: two-component regulator propeller domain-containing protein [Bacteroidia bacterium]